MGQLTEKTQARTISAPKQKTVRQGEPYFLVLEKNTFAHDINAADIATFIEKEFGDVIFKGVYDTKTKELDETHPWNQHPNGVSTTSEEILIVLKDAPSRAILDSVRSKLEAVTDGTDIRNKARAR